MISKKKLRERLIDICNGAGYVWIEDIGYFDGHLEELGGAILGIERSFELGRDTRLRLPWYLKDMADMDSFVDLVHDAIKYDKGDEDE